jgi:hypothetical protein
MDLEFGLELADPLLGCREFRPLGGRQTRDEPSVDVFLTPPGVDRLIADTDVAGEIGNPPPSGEEIEHPSTKLGRITASSHGCLL